MKIFPPLPSVSCLQCTWPHTLRMCGGLQRAEPCQPVRLTRCSAAGRGRVRAAPGHRSRLTSAAETSPCQASLPCGGGRGNQHTCKHACHVFLPRVHQVTGKLFQGYCSILDSVVFLLLLHCFPIYVLIYLHIFINICTQTYIIYIFLMTYKIISVQHVRMTCRF